MKQFINPHEVECIQSRTATQPTLIQEYLEMMQNGIVFDPVKAIRTAEGALLVWDGKHRTEAAKRFGEGYWADIEDGTRADAEWHSFAANKSHGLRRNREDIAKAIHDALGHPFAQDKSDREIASWIGCDHKTVGKYRKELEVSGEIPQMITRAVTRGASRYELTLPTREDEPPLYLNDAQTYDERTQAAIKEAQEMAAEIAARQATAAPADDFDEQMICFKCKQHVSARDIVVFDQRNLCPACYAARDTPATYPQAEIEMILRRDFLPFDQDEALKLLTEILHESEQGKIVKANLHYILKNGGKTWQEPILYTAIRSVRSHLLARKEAGYVAHPPQRECTACHTMYEVTSLRPNDICYNCLDRLVDTFAGQPMVATIFAVLDRRLTDGLAREMKRFIYEAVRFGSSS